MENREIPETTPLPGVIKTIGEGCNLVAKKAYLLLAPVILDIFLLFGPKLRIDEYLKPALEALFNQIMATAGNAGVRQLELMIDMTQQALSTVNLFGFLQTFPIGVNVIFSSSGNTTPFGQSVVIQLTSTLGILALIALFMTLGVFLGTVYFSFTAATAKENEKMTLKTFGTQLLNIILFYIILIIFAAILAVPFSCVLTFIFMAAPAVYQIMLLLVTIFACWIMIPLFFIPHGIFINGFDIIQAIKESIKMAAWCSPLTIRFILLSLILSFGLDMIWTIPDQSSWLILFSIFGHAFVTTTLLASSFILYRELSQWQKENRSFLEWRKANLRFKQFLKKEPETND